MWTRRSVRCTATRNKAPRMATRGCWAITRCSRRGAERFVRELVGRVRRAGATGSLTLRADSGFWSKHVIQACRDHEVAFSITVNQNKAVVAAIALIPENAWVPN